MSKDDIKKSTFKKRLFSNKKLRKKWLHYTAVIWLFVIPFIAHVAYPNSDQICDKSYESELRVPDWVEDCESFGWDYESRFDDGPVEPINNAVLGFPVGIYLIMSIFAISILGSFWLVLRSPETFEESDLESIREDYDIIILNIIMIFVTISIIIFNLLTRPKLNAYSEGNIDARDWLNSWENARFLSTLFPFLIYMWFYSYILFIKREVSPNHNKISGMHIKQVEEVNRKLRLIQPHISKTIIEEIESELYQLNIDLKSETIRNQDLEKTISKLQAKISTLEKSNPQISQNVNITIRDSVVMDTSFDNSINNSKPK